MTSDIGQRCAAVELIYENNVLKSISHSQGRIVPDGAGWEYQYFLKDHLGNVRVTFTAKTQTPVTVSTNFESSSNSNFQNYSNQTFDLVDHTDAGTVYQKVQWLNGGVNGRVGLAKSVEVMPGDRIEFSAYCKYMNIGSTGNPNALITSLAAAFGVGPGSTGEQLKLYNGLSGWAGTGAGPDHNGDDDAVPKAFVTVLFFDRNYNLVDAAWEQVSSQGAQTSATVKQPPHDFLSIDVRAPEAGFAYVFLSNEDPTFVDVYFDDASFTHTPSPIVGVSDYFPFGMQFYSGDRVASSPQKTLFNSKELQTDFSLNWYDFGARMFDPAIGRWHVQDPVAQFASPYIGIGNNPFNMVDPDGMSAYNDYMDDMYGEGEYDRRGESAHHWSRGTNPLSDLGGSYGERNATAHLNDIMDDFTDVERGRVVSTESDGTTSVFVDYYTLGDFMNGNVSQDEYQKYLEDFLHENFDKEIKLLNGLAAKKTKEDKEGKKYGVKFWIDPSEKYVEDITMPGAAFWSKNKQKVFITVHALPVLLAMVRNDKDLLLVIMSHELTHGIDMLNGYETYWLSWYGEETGRNIIEHHAYTTSAEMEKRLGVDFGSQRMLFRINAPPPEEYMIMQH